MQIQIHVSNIKTTMLILLSKLTQIKIININAKLY